MYWPRSTGGWWPTADACQADARTVVNMSTGPGYRRGAMRELACTQPQQPSGQGGPSQTCRDVAFGLPGRGWPAAPPFDQQRCMVSRPVGVAIVAVEHHRRTLQLTDRNAEIHFIRREPAARDALRREFPGLFWSPALAEGRDSDAAILRSTDGRAVRIQTPSTNSAMLSVSIRLGLAILSSSWTSWAPGETRGRVTRGRPGARPHACPARQQ